MQTSLRFSLMVLKKFSTNPSTLEAPYDLALRAEAEGRHLMTRIQLL